MCAWQGIFLNGDTERILCETVKVMLGLFWRSQDAGDGRTMECLPKNILGNDRDKREKCAVVNKAGRSWMSKELSKPSEVTHRSTGFGVRPAGLWSCLVQFFLTMF